ncbi:MAG: hypothetical protein E7256_11865 [Lachnospiraceae bacterium]|nr:hypothetical protein [Lachnospiraceae bacterium]
MKKKFLKKFFSVSLAAVAVSSMVLTGCSKKSDSDTKAASSEVSDQGTEKAETPALTIWAYWTNGDLYSDQGDWEYWKAVEEACNVDLQFLDSSGGNEALSLLAGTDDLPDIIIDYDFTFPGGVQKMLSDGSIIALNDLMDKGCLPNFKAYLESDPEADKLCKNNEQVCMDTDDSKTRLTTRIQWKYDPSGLVRRVRT